MSKLYLMLTITARERLTEFIRLYREQHIDVNSVSVAHGTAGREVLSILGLETSEKVICFSPVTDTAWRAVKKELRHRLYIDVPGTGIAFTVPMSSIGGRRALDYFTDGQTFTEGEEETLKGTEYELLITVCNQGYSETVMDAARAVGAPGGTVIHAKGTGADKAEKFLGFSLATEKDMIFIVSKTGEKNAIMDAIISRAGTSTKAGAIVFSLPVTDTAGLRLIDDSDESEPKAE